MEPLTGAIVAALVAWASVVAAVVLPLERAFDPARLRTGAGVVIGLLAATALGAPLPAWLPLAALGLAFMAALRSPRSASPGRVEERR